MSATSAVVGGAAAITRIAACIGKPRYANVYSDGSVGRLHKTRAAAEAAGKLPTHRLRVWLKGVVWY